MSFVACVGSREVPSWLQVVCEAYGRFYAESGFRVSTGNAPGADQHFALGAGCIHPELVDLYLPWRSFEQKAIVEGNQVFLADQATPEHLELAREAHPTWDRLAPTVRKLMIRNAMIVRGLGAEPAVGMVACPDKGKLGWGGTGHAMRVAKWLGVQVVLLPGGAVWDGRM